MWSYEEWKLFWEMLNSMPEFSIGEKPVAEPVCFSGIHDGKRNTEKQASLYDAMYAEIMEERMRKKIRRMRKPDNRTREQRLSDWDAEKQSRKDRKWDRDWELYNRDWKARADGMSHNMRKNFSAEKVDRADYEVELRNIAEYAEQEAIRKSAEQMYAESMEYINRMEHVRKLVEWLEWA